jgi:hypothetical protein
LRVVGRSSADHRLVERAFHARAQDQSRRRRSTLFRVDLVFHCLRVMRELTHAHLPWTSRGLDNFRVMNTISKRSALSRGPLGSSDRCHRSLSETNREGATRRRELSKRRHHRDTGVPPLRYRTDHDRWGYSRAPRFGNEPGSRAGARVSARGRCSSCLPLPIVGVPHICARRLQPEFSVSGCSNAILA